MNKFLKMQFINNKFQFIVDFERMLWDSYNY